MTAFYRLCSYVNYYDYYYYSGGHALLPAAHDVGDHPEDDPSPLERKKLEVGHFPIIGIREFGLCLWTKIHSHPFIR